MFGIIVKFDVTNHGHDVSHIQPPSLPLPNTAFYGNALVLKEFTLKNCFFLYTKYVHCWKIYIIYLYEL